MTDQPVNPFARLAQSRRAWIALLDCIVILITYFVSKYVPSVSEDLKFVIAALQIPVALLLTYFTVDDINVSRITAGLEKQSMQHEHEIKLEALKLSVPATTVTTGPDPAQIAIDHSVEWLQADQVQRPRS